MRTRFEGRDYEQSLATRPRGRYCMSAVVATFVTTPPIVGAQEDRGPRAASMASAGGGNLLTSTTIGATGNGGEPHGTSQEWEGKSLLHELDDEVVDLRRQIAELRVERKAQCEVQTAQAERLVMMNQQVEQAQADEDSARSESSRLASQLRMRESELSAERKRAETLESQANSLYARALEMSATHTACEEARLAATREAEELRRKLDAATATLREKRSEAERLEKARRGRGRRSFAVAFGALSPR